MSTYATQAAIEAVPYSGVGSATVLVCADLLAADGTTRLTVIRSAFGSVPEVSADAVLDPFAATETLVALAITAGRGRGGAGHYGATLAAVDALLERIEDDAARGGLPRLAETLANLRVTVDAVLIGARSGP